ncbi:MAG: aspartyl protease family protein [bacterium]|nr:aspartyl protease family protein [bacterium]
MRITYVQVSVSGSKGKPIRCRFLVDSGAAYSQLHEEVWSKLGLIPQTEMEFSLADGTLIKRKISECLFEYQGISRHSPVVLGEKGDPALLGAVTLETMGLVLDPFKRTLQPMQLTLASK